MPNKKNKKNKREAKSRSRPLASSKTLKFKVRPSAPVHHREFLGAVTGNAAFTVSKYSLQPGMKDVFPYLEKKSRNWQFYRVEKLVAKYTTRSPATQAGTVIMALDYRPEDAAPVSEVEAMNSAGAENFAVWQDGSIELDCKAAQSQGAWKQLRFEETAEDLIGYDLANLYVCTTGVTGGPIEIGRLSIELSIKFMVPQNTDQTLVKKVRTATMLSIQASAGVHNTPQVAVLTPALTNGAAHDGLNLLSRPYGANAYIPARGLYRIKARGGFTNSVSEAGYQIMQIVKNGVAISTAQGPYVTPTIGQHGTVHTAVHEFFNGVDDFIEVARTAVGATGALALEAGHFLMELL